MPSYCSQLFVRVRANGGYKCGYEIALFGASLNKINGMR